MKRVGLVATTVILALAGSCARAPAPEPAATPQAAPSTLGLAWSAGAEDGMGWFFNPASDGVKLAYGAPNSDAVRLMIYCQGAGRLRLETTTTATAEGPHYMTVISGDSQTVTPARAEANPMGGGRILSVDLPATAEPITAFRTTGQLTLNSAGGTTPLHAGQADAPAVQSFFQACA